jgi:hypothetical protein|tara:strand:- start:14 stop:286 length:273 start_codon:yes stop_codon:yes gene_type:complete
MAKRKTPKVKKPSKITNEHLKKVQGVINDMNRFKMEIGAVETRKHTILHNIAELTDQLTLIRDEFQRDYGTTDINIETGEIKYESNEQAD